MLSSSELNDIEFKDLLDTARNQGDVKAMGEPCSADEIIRIALRGKGKKNAKTFDRQGFNHLLGLADALVETPELALINHSNLREELDHMPSEVVDYFDPIEAPDWVDPEKIRIASELWMANTIPMLLTLYSASLPACYLIKRGIPALYTTQKLAKGKYISQRLYETAFMLDAVMDPSGMKVITGIKAKPKRKRYLWGRGYLAAKKVRALHAAMRLMLKHPVHQPKKAPLWDMANGEPINQEDLAFTLLTFGLLLPQGIQKWGCTVSLEQREAFLHLWKVVGYVMGIRTDLTTDRWDEAASLYNRLLAREAGASHAGRELTHTVMDFVGRFLPRFGGFEKSLPASLVVHQMGSRRAGMLMDRKTFQESQTAVPKLVSRVALGLLWCRYQIRDHVLATLFPFITKPISNLLHETGQCFFESFRAAYRRKPFDIPPNAKEWIRKEGVTQQYLSDLQTWRETIFNWTLVSIICLTGSTCLITAAILGAFMVNWAIVETLGFSALGLTGFAVGIMKWYLPGLKGQRPRLPA